MAKNTVNQRQFRGPAPDQPVDYEDRVNKKEANPPSRSRSSRALGTDIQARPGLSGLSDFGPKKRGK